jgi:hypothetical protein
MRDFFSDNDVVQLAIQYLLNHGCLGIQIIAYTVNPNGLSCSATSPIQRLAATDSQSCF